MRNIADLAVGALFVIFYAINRFNTPPTNRYSTTSRRYYLALSAYLLVAITWYVLLVSSPHLVSFFAGGGESLIPEYAKNLSFPLVASLLTTVLLPKVQPLCSVDKWVLERLHRMGAIPSQARALSASLKKKVPLFTNDLRLVTSTKLQEEGMLPDEISFDGSTQSLPYRWTRLTAILLKMEDVGEQTKFACYLDAFQDDLARLKSRRSRIARRAGHYFEMARFVHSTENRNDSAGKDLTDKELVSFKRVRDDLQDELEEFEVDVCDYLSRGVLFGGNTETARAELLERFGYSVPIQRAPFTIHQLLLLCTFITAVMLVGFLASYHVDSSNTTANESIIKAFKVSIFFCASVFCAVLPKERSREKCTVASTPPYALYLFSGLSAALATEVVSFAIECMSQGSISGALSRLGNTYPWLILPGALATITSALCDNAAWPMFSKWQQSIVEGCLTVAIMCIMGIATWWLLFEVNKSSSYVVPNVWFVLSVSGCIGGVVGLLVPTWYREAPRSSNPNDIQPHLTLTRLSSWVRIRITLCGAECVNIYSSAEGTPSVIVARHLTHTIWDDKMAKLPGRRNYFAKGVIGQEEVGMSSAVISIDWS